MTRARQETGRLGEQLAVTYLRNKGYAIVELNFRTRFGEIDIIARDGVTVVFVEVRTRTTLSRGTGAESVNMRKQQKVRSMAEWYIHRHFIHEASIRFDVVSILILDPPSRVKIDHIINAF